LKVNSHEAYQNSLKPFNFEWKVNQQPT